MTVSSQSTAVATPDAGVSFAISGRRVALAIAGRSLRLIPRLPSTFIPSLLMPIFFTIVFSEGFSGISRLPGFPTNDTINWFVPTAALMGSGFAGITTGLGVARDLEIGFYERFLASPVPRSSLIAGAMAAGAVRALIPTTLTVIVGTLLGAHLPGGLEGILPLAVAAMGIALCASAWSLGIALRFKTLQSAPLMQMGMFLTLFLSTLQMPLVLLTGWLKHVATYNPVTYVLQLARQGFLGGISWSDTWPGLAALAGMLVLLTTFAGRGMRRVIP
jgi:ABC-2 type transport system permease protein